MIRKGGLAVPNSYETCMCQGEQGGVHKISRDLFLHLLPDGSQRQERPGWSFSMAQAQSLQKTRFDDANRVFVRDDPRSHFAYIRPESLLDQCGCETAQSRHLIN